MLIPYLVGGGIAVAIFGALGYEKVLPHFHGATPQQLADEPLARSPTQLGHDLPMTEVKFGTVSVKLRSGACEPYAEAEFGWSESALDAPETMRLVAERGHGSTNGATIGAALRRHLPAFRGSYQWTTFSLSTEGNVADVTLTVHHFAADGAPNPLFDRQLEAARQLVLNAACNTPIKVSDRELADVLGAGYPTADVAKFDPATKFENAASALHALFPGEVAISSHEWQVSLDHPLLPSVMLLWHDAPGGTMTRISFSVIDAFASSVPLLASCLEKKVGPPMVDLTAGQKDYTFDVGSLALHVAHDGIAVRSKTDAIVADDFARLFRALDACREATEAVRGAGM